MSDESLEKNINNKNALLGILFASLQYFWTYYISIVLKKSGTLADVTSPFGFIPLFLYNLLIAAPMLIVLFGSIIHYKRDFDDKLMYIKTERYVLTLILTTIYTLFLPLSTRLSASPKHGALAWFYFLFFIAFLEEFLYRGMIPTLLDRSSFPLWIKILLPALAYGLYQSAMPFAKYGVNIDTLLKVLPDVLWSTLFHFALMAMKKWSGAMWLPVIVHAITDLLYYLIF